MTVLNFNEDHNYDDLVKLTPLPNGLYIGTCNWKVEIGTHKIGILSNSSMEAGFRHPLNINISLWKNADVLLVNRIINQS